MCPRLRKPLALHELHGTRAQYTDDESHVAGALPRPPKHLTKVAKKSFRGFVKQLAERRAVTAGDGALIAMLCVIEERWLAALENLRDEGVVVEYTRLDSNGQQVTVEKPNINLKIAETAERQMVAILSKLGLSPRDRELVKQTAPVATGKEQTVAEALDAEIASLEQQDAVAAESAVEEEEEDLLSTIDEKVADTLTEAEQLLREADEALAEENDE